MNETSWKNIVEQMASIQMFYILCLCFNNFQQILAVRRSVNKLIYAGESAGVSQLFSNVDIFLTYSIFLINSFSYMSVGEHNQVHQRRF